MISIEQVACFSVVYELQSYSAASKKLGKARSTVRERISALEDIMAVELFVMEGKKAIPTEVAHRLYPRARLLTRQSIEFENIALSAYQGLLSNITIYYDSLIPSQLLLAIESEIKAQQKGISINWLQRDRNHCLAQIEKGEALLAIMPGMGKLHPNVGIGNINLGSFPLGIFTSVNSSIPNHPVSLAEIATEQQLIFENDLTNELRHSQLSSEFEVVTSEKIVIEKLKLGGWVVANIDDMQRYIRAGDVREVALIEAPSFIRQECIMFYNMSSEISPQESQIIDIVAKVAKRLKL